MRGAERAKAAKLQGLSREMTPEVTALIKRVETTMASVLAHHETRLKKTEKHPFFLRLNDHRNGVPVRTQGIKTITCIKIDMTAGMVDAWMAALLANKLFMGDFNEVLKPFPGDLQHVQWLHDTELGLHECRKATGPVPAKDVRRAGAFELLATLIMPNAVLTTPSLSATVCSKTRAKKWFSEFFYAGFWGASPAWILLRRPRGLRGPPSAAGGP